LGEGAVSGIGPPLYLEVGYSPEEPGISLSVSHPCPTCFDHTDSSLRSRSSALRTAYRDREPVTSRQSQRGSSQRQRAPPANRSTEPCAAPPSCVRLASAQLPVESCRVALFGNLPEHEKPRDLAAATRLAGSLFSFAKSLTAGLHRLRHGPHRSTCGAHSPLCDTENQADDRCPAYSHSDFLFMPLLGQTDNLAAPHSWRRR
jgi:hypothetical protein